MSRITELRRRPVAGGVCIRQTRRTAHLHSARTVLCPVSRGITKRESRQISQVGARFGWPWAGVPEAGAQQGPETLRRTRSAAEVRGGSWGRNGRRRFGREKTHCRTASVARTASLIWAAIANVDASRIHLLPLPDTRPVRVQDAANAPAAARRPVPSRRAAVANPLPGLPATSVQQWGRELRQ
jgi:hypothetical protein